MAILRHHLLRRERPRLHEITLTRDYKGTGKSFTVGFFHATGVLKHRVKCNLLWFFDDNQCWGCLGWTLPTDAPEVARRWYESIHRLDLLHFLFLDLRRVLFFFAATHVDRNTSSGRKKHRAGAVRIYVSILTSDDLVRHLRSILGSHGASLTARQARERLITVVEMVRSTDGGRIARDDQVFYLRLQLAFNYGSPSISQWIHAVLSHRRPISDTQHKASLMIEPGLIHSSDVLLELGWLKGRGTPQVFGAWYFRVSILCFRRQAFSSFLIIILQIPLFESLGQLDVDQTRRRLAKFRLHGWGQQNLGVVLAIKSRRTIHFRNRICSLICHCHGQGAWLNHRGTEIRFIRRRIYLSRYFSPILGNNRCCRLLVLFLLSDESNRQFLNLLQLPLLVLNKAVRTFHQPLRLSFILLLRSLLETLIQTTLIQVPRSADLHTYLLGLHQRVLHLHLVGKGGWWSVLPYYNVINQRMLWGLRAALGVLLALVHINGINLRCNLNSLFLLVIVLLIKLLFIRQIFIQLHSRLFGEKVRLFRVCFFMEVDRYWSFFLNFNNYSLWLIFQGFGRRSCDIWVSICCL